MPLDDQVDYRWVREDSAVRFVRAVHEHGLANSVIYREAPVPGITHARVAEMTGISRPTVSGLADRAHRFMITSGSEPGLALDPSAVGVAVGVDFSYGHNRVALSDIHGQLFLPEHPAAYEMSVSQGTPADDSLAWATERITALVAEAKLQLTDVVAIGVALAGATDQATNLLVPDSRPMNAGWQSLSPVDELPVRLSIHAPVYLDNDTNASAIAEHGWGAARGAANVLYIKLNRSCNCALIIRHEIYRGAQGFAGEIGHVLVPLANGSDGNGGFAELHDVFSVAALRRRFGIEDSASELVATAYKNDAMREAFMHGAHVLGGVLAPIIDVLNPERIIIGGKLGYECFPLIASELNAAIEDHHSSPAIKSLRGKVVRGQIPGRTALHGAIALALKKTLPELLAREIPSEVARKREKRNGRAA
jgi:predicted NBD/HSP70 family sugar kinase